MQSKIGCAHPCAPLGVRCSDLRPNRVRAQSIVGYQPVRAHRVDCPGRVLPGQYLRDGPDARWVSLAGREFGLFRFDGVHSIPWQPPAGQHLPAAPYSLLVTRDGTLWIGTFNGLVSWSGGKLTSYPEFGRRFVTSLLEDREGTVWAGILGSAPGTPTGRLCAIRNGNAQCYGEMAPSAHSFGVCVRTAQALFGLAPNLGFGDGSPVLQSAMRCPERGDW